MAKPRKPFSQLKPATQERKSRYYAKHHGLTAKEVQRRYDAGTLGSQKAARGHARTPEKPGAPVPAGSTYRTRLNQAINFVQDFKESKWSHRPKWNAARSRKAVSHDPETGKARGIRELRIIENMVKLAIEDELDWHDIVALDYDEESAFYYH